MCHLTLVRRFHSLPPELDCFAVQSPLGLLPSGVRHPKVLGQIDSEDWMSIHALVRR